MSMSQSQIQDSRSRSGQLPVDISTVTAPRDLQGTPNLRTTPTRNLRKVNASYPSSRSQREPLLKKGAYDAGGLSTILSRCFRSILLSCSDSSRSSLSQPVTRDTRRWRFIRRHLFGTRPNTNCQMVLGPPGGVTRLRAGRRVPPAPMLTQGPTGATRAGTAGGVPPCPPAVT